MRFKNISGHTIYLPILPRKNPVVLDLGGNNGAFADWVFNAFAGKVYVVEALPELADALSRDRRLTVMHAAVIKQHPFCKSGFSEVGHLASMVR